MRPTSPNGADEPDRHAALEKEARQFFGDDFVSLRVEKVRLIVNVRTEAAATRHAAMFLACTRSGAELCFSKSALSVPELPQPVPVIRCAILTMSLAYWLYKFGESALTLL